MLDARAHAVPGRRRAAAAWFAVFLASWAPGNRPAVASEGRARAAWLNVTSDPHGADVYVNGQLKGRTPLDLHDLAPGGHRLTMVKEGYVENSRWLRLEAAQNGSVAVRLTPAPQASAAQSSASASTRESGRRRKLLFIGTGAVAVGAGIWLLVGGNKAPTPGTITASPGSGIAGATPIRFSAPAASDPDGDPLTFAWNLGDGANESGAAVTHIYQQAGSFNVTLTVSDAKKSATASASVTIRNLTGSWRGSISGFSPPTVATLTHNGGAVAGTMSFPGFNLPGGQVSGRVSSPLGVTFTVSVPGFLLFSFHGAVDDAATRLTGTATGSGFSGNSWTLTRQ